MKKSILLTVFLLLTLINTMIAGIVDIRTARQAAGNFYLERLVVNLQQNVTTNDLKLSSEFTEWNNSEPVYYLFNYADRGFILISAEDACYPILGYSFDVTLSPEAMPDVMKQWLNNYVYEIQSVRQSGLEADAEIDAVWKRLLSPVQNLRYAPVATTDVAPLITSLWNQDFPYNAMCPADPGSTGSYYGRVPVGCVATSMSQIMHYWRYPETGNGYNCIWPQQAAYGPQCADFGATTYDWNGMPNQTYLESEALAVLSYHCAVSVNMQFDPSGSGSNLQRSAYALKTNFKYASSTIYQNRYSDYNAWANLMKSEVDAGRPVQYAGDDNSAGHAFVLDGYQQVGSDYMFHFNWGWGGSANGYFNLNNLNPNGSNFNYHQGAVTGIEPDPNQYPGEYYCSGNKTITTNFGAIEDGSGPLASYQPNGTCSWLIAPDDSVKNITLNFIRFATAPDHFVKIYDGTDANAPLLASYSGTLTSMPSVTTTGPAMYITFHTPGSTTAQGWLANFTTTMNAFCNANTTITWPSGIITDGSDRFNYRNLSNCKWKIMPTGVTKVVLTVNKFKTEPEKDKVMVYDLGTSALLATWSGEYTTMPNPVISETGSVMIMWGSNNSVRSEGWEIGFSPMVGISGNKGFSNLMVYPNPAGEMVSISFTATESGSAEITLLSPEGKVCRNTSFKVLPGEFKEMLNVSGLAQGIYILRIQSETGNAVQKIVKK